MYSYYVKEVDRFEINLNFLSLVWLMDNSRYTNHSNQPNSGYAEVFRSDSQTVSSMFCSAVIRDVKAGEEIFEDYRPYDQCPWAPEVTSGHFVQ